MNKEYIEIAAARYEEHCNNQSVKKHFIDGVDWAEKKLTDGLVNIGYAIYVSLLNKLYSVCKRIESEQPEFIGILQKLYSEMNSEKNKDNENIIASAFNKGFNHGKEDMFKKSCEAYCEECRDRSFCTITDKEICIDYLEFKKILKSKLEL